MNKFEQVHENGSQVCGFPMWIGGLKLGGLEVNKFEQVLCGHMGEFT